jgi:hypothetical protein
VTPFNSSNGFWIGFPPAKSHSIAVTDDTPVHTYQDLTILQAYIDRICVTADERAVTDCINCRLQLLPASAGIVILASHIAASDRTQDIRACSSRDRS